MGTKILIVEDNLILCDMLQRWLQKAGYDTVTATDEPSARKKIRGNDVALVLADVRLPEGDGISLLEWSTKHGAGIPFVIMTGYGSISDAVRAIKLDAKDYLPKPVNEEHLLELLHDLLQQPVIVRKEARTLERQSPAAQKTDRLARRVACADLSVMILGPNGCGKESVARTIHRNSRRGDKPFVAVNCGCVPKELAASEFFGHVKGAFTGADKPVEGYFAAAMGGTLFLDEIGNMPYEMQILLLRVLQERTYSPVGSRELREADVRILAATNEDMNRAIREGRFREDLYHRLAEFEITQPSLAECPEDILPLAAFFRERYSEEMKLDTLGFTKEAESLLLSYSWPGNVRELCNRVKRAVLLAETPLLSGENLGLAGNAITPPEGTVRKFSGNEADRVRQALEDCDGNISHAAESLGVSRPTLYKKMRKYGLDHIQ